MMPSDLADKMNSNASQNSVEAGMYEIKRTRVLFIIFSSVLIVGSSIATAGEPCEKRLIYKMAKNNLVKAEKFQNRNDSISANKLLDRAIKMLGTRYPRPKGMFDDTDLALTSDYFLIKKGNYEEAVDNKIEVLKIRLQMYKNGYVCIE